MVNIKDTIECIKAEGFTVQNWKPGDKRIFKVLDSYGNEASYGMYSNELRAWYTGFLQGAKYYKALNKGIVISKEVTRNGNNKE